MKKYIFILVLILSTAILAKNINDDKKFKNSVKSLRQAIVSTNTGLVLSALDKVEKYNIYDAEKEIMYRISIEKNDSLLLELKRVLYTLELNKQK